MDQSVDPWAPEIVDELKHVIPDHKIREAMKRALTESAWRDFGKMGTTKRQTLLNKMAGLHHSSSRSVPIHVLEAFNKLIGAESEGGLRSFSDRRPQPQTDGPTGAKKITFYTGSNSPSMQKRSQQIKRARRAAVKSAEL